MSFDSHFVIYPLGTEQQWVSQKNDVNIFYKLAYFIIEPRYEISNNVVCVTSKASDQPAHALSLIRAFASPLNIL